MLLSSAPQALVVAGMGVDGPGLSDAAVGIVEDLISRLITNIKASDLKCTKKIDESSPFFILRAFLELLVPFASNDDFLASSLKDDVTILYHFACADILDKTVVKETFDAFGMVGASLLMAPVVLLSPSPCP